MLIVFQLTYMGVFSVHRQWRLIKKRKPPVKSETKNNAEYEQQLRSSNIGDVSYPTWVLTVEQEKQFVEMKKRT